MSLILIILGLLFSAAGLLFSSLAGSEGLSPQGLLVARLVRFPFLIVGGLCLVLAPLLAGRSSFRQRLRNWLPPESQLVLPGLLGLALVEGVFVLAKLGEYSSTLVSRERFWDNYVLLGRFPVRIPNEPFTFGDYLNSTLLFTAGVVALLVRGFLSMSSSRPAAARNPSESRVFSSSRPAAARDPSGSDRVFWTMLGVGFVYLALDEMLMFHEFIGANLRFDDGRIILGYLGLMGLTALVFRRKFLRHPVAVGCLIAGALCQGLGAFADRFHFWEEGFTPEEVAELTASGLYLLAILQYACADMRALIERRHS